MEGETLNRRYRGKEGRGGKKNGNRKGREERREKEEGGEQEWEGMGRVEGKVLERSRIRKKRQGVLGGDEGLGRSNVVRNMDGRERVKEDKRKITEVSNGGCNQREGKTKKEGR